MKLAIIIEGGCLVNIMCDNKQFENIEYRLVDYDIDGVDERQLRTASGNEKAYIGMTSPVEANPTFVNGIFAQHASGEAIEEKSCSNIS